MTRHRWRNRAVMVMAWTLTAAWAVVMVLLLWPYNDVRFPQGNVATVTPTSVPELGTLWITFPEFCNDGQDTTVTRWADLYVDGRRVASERLNDLSFYPAAIGLGCRAPDRQEVGLTTAFQAYGGKPTTYSIRTVTTYKPNPIRTVQVEAVTETFTVTP